VVSTPLKNMLVKLGSSSPGIGVIIKKYLSCHQPAAFFLNDQTALLGIDTLGKFAKEAPRGDPLRPGEISRQKRCASDGFFFSGKLGGNLTSRLPSIGNPWDFMFFFL